MVTNTRVITISQAATVYAVEQHCCNGDLTFLWENDPL